ncbi:hypothetical protein ACFPRL_16575 [Pseudoclavibacter helvolus]
MRAHPRSPSSTPTSPPCALASSAQSKQSTHSRATGGAATREMPLRFETKRHFSCASRWMRGARGVKNAGGSRAPCAAPRSSR